MSTEDGGLALVGGHGFLGWHTAVRLRALHGLTPRRLGRADPVNGMRLAQRLEGADTVIHVAGTNRADSEDEVELGNLSAARTLAEALARVEHPCHVVYANTIQAGRDHGYGRSKAAAADILADAATATGGTFVDVKLPNLFGEHGRPHYNSVVATFCHLVATRREPEVDHNGIVSLLHAQDAAAVLISAARSRRTGEESPTGERHGVGEVLDRIESFQAVYGHGEIPALVSKFDVDLFNTYRSFLFPDHFPIHPQLHADARGALVETVRSHGGQGMAFASTTKPGRRRGDHYHLSKVERFFVVSGEAEIALRRLYDDRVIRFRLSGDKPGFVDMPTMWAHNISNVGDTELITMFWADQLLDLDNPDQFQESVESAEVVQS